MTLQKAETAATEPPARSKLFYLFSNSTARFWSETPSAVRDLARFKSSKSIFSPALEDWDCPSGSNSILKLPHLESAAARTSPLIHHFETEKQRPFLWTETIKSCGGNVSNLCFTVKLFCNCYSSFPNNREVNSFICQLFDKMLQQTLFSEKWVMEFTIGLFQGNAAKLFRCFRW